MAIVIPITAFTVATQLQQIISYITSPELQRQLFPLKIVFIFFSVVFLVGIIYFLVISSYIKAHFWYDVVEFFSWKPYESLKLVNRWKKIRRRVEKDTESEYKLAIIEADDFLNEVLEAKGYKGKNFDERIGKVERMDLFNKEDIIKAHEVRNSIVYDPDFKLDLEDARAVISKYEEAIRNLGM